VGRARVASRVREGTKPGRRRLVTPAQAAFKPSSSVWSIAENAEHLVLAEQGSVNRVWSAAESLQAGKPLWTGDAVHRRRTIEER
jgi:hypothetical protein